MDYRTYFGLPRELAYFNCATMGLMPRESQEAGHRAIDEMARPFSLTSADFFDPLEALKTAFGLLINAPSERIAYMPSVSYGMATVAKNIRRHLRPDKNEILLVGGEFPSDVYAWDELKKEGLAKTVVVEAPAASKNRGAVWNQRLLEAIGPSTFALCIGPTHWADGTSFDLKLLSAACKNYDVRLFLDTTQHVGAVPFDLQEINVDFLVSAGYKWLLGPYYSTLAYFGPFFDDGLPLEHTWSSRNNSHEFHLLTQYHGDLRPGAFRYNSGEFSSFVLLPMLHKSLEIVRKMDPAALQLHAKNLFEDRLDEFHRLGYQLENEYRNHHILGLRLPAGQDAKQTEKRLIQNGVKLSIRDGNVIRISVHRWNDEEDVDRLMTALT